MRVINYLIVITLIIICLLLRTGGFSVSIWNALSFNHIARPLAIFLILWVIRLIKVRKRGVENGKEGKSSLSPFSQRGVFLCVWLIWLGMKLNSFSFNLFTLYLPERGNSFHPSVTIIFSTFLVDGIGFLVYILTRNLLGDLTAFFATGIFLLSPLSRINTSQLFPSQTIVLLSLGSLIFFVKYLERRRKGAAGGKKVLGMSVAILGFAVLAKWVLLGIEFKFKGFQDWVLFQSRLELALPVVWHYSLWIAGGMVLFILKRRILLILLFLATFLWTFFIANNSALDVYIPLICLLSIMMASCLVWLLQNRFTNRTIFDRNVSLAIVVTFFILSYFSTVGKYVNRPRRSGYEAEKCHHLARGVSVVNDKNASSGKAVLMKKGEREESITIMYGPYDLLLPGNYEASFRLLAEDALEVPVIDIDVVTDFGDTVFGWRDIRGTDFKQGNSYETFSLKFSLEEAARVEYRVCTYGRTDIRIDRMDIRILSR